MRFTSLFTWIFTWFSCILRFTCIFTWFICIFNWFTCVLRCTCMRSTLATVSCKPGSRRPRRKREENSVLSWRKMFLSHQHQHWWYKSIKFSKKNVPSTSLVPKTLMSTYTYTNKSCPTAILSFTAESYFRLSGSLREGTINAVTKTTFDLIRCSCWFSILCSGLFLFFLY